MQLVDHETREILLPHVEVARTLWRRFRGLMFRRQFSEGFGLWLEPCRSVHTMWMRIPIDVYFIDRQGMIVEHRAGVTPWSIVIPSKACRTVLEIPHADRVLKIGTKVCLQDRSRSVDPATDGEWPD